MEFPGYEIIEEKTGGGMAVVYKARNISSGEIRAIKVLKDDYTRNIPEVERFHREAEITRSLACRNIVKVYKEDCVSDGHRLGKDRHYFMMEYIEGAHVGDIISTRRVLPINEIIEIVSPLCDAINYTHNFAHKRIFHRDLKPNNVIIERGTGRVVLTDFGIALAEDSQRFTESFSLMGAAAYMSPEHVKGKVDQRSDLYSLGVMMFEMATGRVPFTGDDRLSILYRHVNESPPDPRSIKPDIPDWVAHIILRLLQKDPRHRYQRADELKEHLNRKWDTGVIPIPTKKFQESTMIPAILAGGFILFIVMVAVGVMFIAKPIGPTDRHSLLERPIRNRQPPITIPPIPPEKEEPIETPSFAILELKTDPDGLWVYLDNKKIDKTPLIINNLEPREYTLGIEGEDIVPLTIPLKLSAGEKKNLGIIKPERYCKISVSTYPGGVNVYLDDDTVKRVTTLSDNKPIVIEKLKKGQHKMRISKTGYEEKTCSFNLSSGEHLEIPIFNLSKIIEYGSVLVSSIPSPCKIFLDGKDTGFLTDYTIPNVPTGEHNVKVSKGPPYEDVEDQVIIKSGQTSQLSFTLHDLRGELIVRTEPPGAIVYVNGSEKGQTDSDFSLKLNAGRYSIRISKQGYDDENQNVIISAGNKEKMDIKLKMKETVLIVKSNNIDTIVLDGSDEGSFFEKRYSVKPGRYEIKSVREEYKNETIVVNMEPGEEKTIEAKGCSIQKDAVLIVKSNNIDNIYIGNYNGGSFSKKEFTLAPGKYEIKSTRNGYEDETTSISLQVGDEKTIELECRRRKPRKPRVGAP